jgi:hypothetical protein
MIRKAVAVLTSAVLCISTALIAGAEPVLAAASLPAATSGQASSVTASGATLTGSIYPSNQATDYYFQYGQTTAYEAQTPLAEAGGGTKTLHVSAAVTGLAPYTTYHYRLVAINSAGTVDGQDRVLTTAKIPLTFTIAAVPSIAVFGSPFVVRGIVSGTNSANRAVVLQATGFPFLAGFKPITNSQLTSATGSFAFSVPGLSLTSHLRVATVEARPIVSEVVVERVAPRITLHVAPTNRPGFVRFYGVVTPGQPGAFVAFQLLRRGAKPKSVGSRLIMSRVRSHSRFRSKVLHLRHTGLYRARIYVVSGGQVSGTSRVILIG